MPSKTEIDRLGNRLREGRLTESDLKSLDDHRRSFREAYDFVVNEIRERLGLQTTGRPAKSTTSIIDKLHRETLRLSQMQDIAGCRIVVGDAASQDSALATLRAEFSRTSIVDRRAHPSFGYRAVHLIVQHSGKPVEIQVRTLLQHLWAEYSEKWSDVLGPEVKYGAGDKAIQDLLMRASRIVETYEMAERKRRSHELLSDSEASVAVKEMIALRAKIIRRFLDNISELEGLSGEPDDLSD